MITRIKEARKALGLSREKFAEGLGLKTRAKIDNIELGRVPPDEPFIQLICKVYGISHDWLLTGEGEMFQQPADHDEAISKFVAEALGDKSKATQRQYLHMLSRLTPEQWEVLADVAEMLVEEQLGTGPPE